MLSVHQHWDPLKVCVVGRCFPPEYFNYIQNSKTRDVFYRIAEETEEDFQKLISVLEKFDVKVIRTDISDNPEDYKRPDESIKPPPITPRDYTAMVGSKFFMPGENFGKNFDVEEEFNKILWGNPLNANNLSDSHKNLLQYIYDLTYPGRPVSLTTQAMLIKSLSKKNKIYHDLLSFVDTDDLKNVIFQGHTNTIGKVTKYEHNDKTYPFRTLEKFVKENGNEIIYDQYINSASMIRMGKDLFFGTGNIINKLNEDNFMKKWRRLFSEYNIHSIDTVGHIDGHTVPIKPGLILSTKFPEFYKDSFPDWEVVRCRTDSMKPWKIKNKKNNSRYWVPNAGDEFYDYVNEWMDDWVTYVDETIFDINLLIIDENNIVCNHNVNKELIDTFERHDITPHPINFRHRYFWDGGLHCMTSDIDRVGNQQDFFS
tara:strand:+ start:69 stop:1349 length:1281 start_codon:yes stop_codon:yes gene_type:complete